MTRLDTVLHDKRRQSSRAAPIRIGIVAGEISGDALGAGLIRELRRELPNIVFEGIAGPRMLAAGCIGLHPMENISFIGLEGLTRVPALHALRRRLVKHFLLSPPDIFIGIDVPDFNLWIEERLKQNGILTMHYVSPSVWAWRGYRIRYIRHAVDHMLTLFPFETRYYKNHGVPVSFVGHPLADKFLPEPHPHQLRRQLGLAGKFRVIALLPGSRDDEVRRHAELLVRTAQWLSTRHPDIKYVVPFASLTTRNLFEQALRHYDVDQKKFLRLNNRSRDAMAASDVVLLASGTATLEAALLGKPMVVTYRLSWVSYLLIRLLAHVRLYSLPNNLAGRELVPEFIQRSATPENLGRAVERYLLHPSEATRVSRSLLRIGRMLRRNADIGAARAVIRLLRRKKKGIK